MKKPTIIGVWLLSSAAAFGLGSFLKLGKESPDSAGGIDGGGFRSVGTMPSVEGGTTTAGGGPKVPGVKKGTEQSPFAAYIRNGEISSEDMQTLMKDVMDENDPIKRAELFTKLLANLTPENAKSAYEQLRQSRGRGDMEKSQLFLNAWGRIDGNGAMAELMARREAGGENEGGRGGRGGFGGRGGPGGDGFEMMSILSGWATTDAAAATAYLNSNDKIDGREKGMLQNGIVEGLLVNGVSEAMQYVSDLPKDDNSREWMMRSIASEVMEGGIDAAASWVTTISDPQLKEGALDSVVGQFARENLEGAAEWVASMAGESYANGAVREIAEQMADADPQKALAWADTLAGEAKPRAYRETLSEWAQDDPTAASEFLLSMNRSSERDQAINGFTSRIQREEPASAIAWAQEIGDPQLQQETLTSAARSWYYSRDREAATAWLETSGLPAEAVEKIIAEPSRDDWRGGGGGFGGGGRRGGDR